ncbi:hypothetical protein [Bdellovibrio reynosensis]|uniref:Uncharacterized protein n=1 Tax=Bdellovibrio reynosensis TaxID=2835041 RepID=A0ABY4C519_9BACT|nr:hypothetical protein [Bdellovibrio reynosensis]UOF00057.1 hypothetical protein MNR06_10125 [Bdellovibrio reynosensis]
MIREALIYLLNPATPLAKKYGFLYSSVALQHRYERCKKIWIPHLKNCQDLFLEAVNKLPQKKSVIILGSAHLHEIPMHLLVQNFESITLVDVIHPLKHHWLAKRNSRLKLITMDLSNSLDKLDALTSFADLQELLSALTKEKLFHFEADLIVSANILSQLALLPIDALEKKIKRPLTLEEKDLVCTAFAENHLKNLSQCQGRKLIYADREVIYRDPKGEEIYKGHYPVDFAGYKKLKEWMWMLAPLKEASKDYSIEMKIEAYEG